MVMFILLEWFCCWEFIICKFDACFAGGYYGGYYGNSYLYGK